MSVITITVDTQAVGVENAVRRSLHALVKELTQQDVTVWVAADSDGERIYSALHEASTDPYTRLIVGEES